MGTWEGETSLRDRSASGILVVAAAVLVLLAVALTAVLLVTSLAVPAAAGEPEVTALARTLAENVLGGGAVRSVRLTADGTSLALTWEWATYRQGLPRAGARSLIYAEAELATGSILGRLRDIDRVRFAIVKDGRHVAAGENLRGAGVTVRFDAALGGGIIAPAPAGAEVTSPARGKFAPKD